jgi:hypothetical protein
MSAATYATADRVWLNYAAGADADCETCPYWRRPNRSAVDQDTGECRRHGPRGNGTWPATEISGWCGDHPTMSGATAGTYNEDADRVEFLVREGDPHDAA